MSEVVEKLAKPIACEKVCVHYSECVPFVNPVVCSTIELRDDIAESVKHAGYLPVQEVQLEVLTFNQEQILGLIPAQAILDYDKAKEVLEKVSQATNAHNEAKGQLFRRAE